MVNPCGLPGRTAIVLTFLRRCLTFLSFVVVTPTAVNPWPAQESVSLLLASRVFGVGFSPSSVAVGDFNGDSLQDLAVANSSSGDVSILLGNGDGTFLAAQNFGAGRTWHSLLPCSRT